MLPWAVVLHRWFPADSSLTLHLLLETAVCLGTAAFCGFLVGIERERRDRPAGLRTHILVCVGSAAFVHLGVTAHLLGGGFGTIADFNRLIQSVAVGIGFLGAGAIFRAGDHVSGITTAASIWVMGAAGAAAGAGAVLFALGLSIFTYAVLRGLSAFERRIKRSDEPAP
ncbi:MAG: MgtC/SapB family protein [Planctomycetota bacterium]